MHLNYFQLLAAATLAAPVDAVSATSGVALSKLNSVNAVGPANPHEINNPRFLRMQKKVNVADEKKENEEREERMWSSVSGWVSTNVNAVKGGDEACKGNIVNSMSQAIKNLDDAGEVNALFIKFKPELRKMFPDFEDGMSLTQFTMMVLNTRTDEKALLAIGAYKKYLERLNPALLHR